MHSKSTPSVPGRTYSVTSSGGTLGTTVQNDGDEAVSVNCNRVGTMNVVLADPDNNPTVLVQNGVTGLTITCN